jgi:hypothetical protein
VLYFAAKRFSKMSSAFQGETDQIDYDIGLQSANPFTEASGIFFGLRSIWACVTSFHARC